MQISLRDLLKNGKNYLESRHIDDSSFDATQLLLFVLNVEYSKFLENQDSIASLEIIKNYNKLLELRADNQPLQYIIGKWDFYKDTFFVGPGVLIPRPETEQLVEICINQIKANGYKIIYDLCTGSGCIGLSIAKECKNVFCYMFDYYDNALDYAIKNMNNLNLNNVKIIKYNVLNNFNLPIPKADLIVSNPPYIESYEILSLQKEVQKEPLTALDGGKDGLDFYKAINSNWIDKLNKNGCLIVEHGENQTNSVKSIFSNKLECNSIIDLYGNYRFVFGKKTGG